MRIFHIADLADWDAAVAVGRYEVSTRGRTLAEVGFVHASRTRDQVERVAGFVYRDAEGPLVVLELDEEAILASGTPVIDEDGGAGELFPHIYGTILPEWALAVRPAAFGPDGAFTF